MRRQLAASYDFYSLSGCRDLVFHTQERTFTLPEVSALTRDLGLELLRVETRNPHQEALYRARFPNDRRASCMANWELLEREQPQLFGQMYCFWLCRAEEREAVDLEWIRSAERR